MNNETRYNRSGTGAADGMGKCVVQVFITVIARRLISSFTPQSSFALIPVINPGRSLPADLATPEDATGLFKIWHN